MIIIAVVLTSAFFYRQYYLVPAKEVMAQGNTLSPTEEVFPVPEKTHYEMKLYFDPIKRVMYGSSLIQTVNTTTDNMNNIWFTTYPNAFKQKDQTPAPLDAYYEGFDSGWIDIENIRINRQEVSYENKGVSNQIKLPTAIVPNEKIIIEMLWQVHIPKVGYRFGYKEGVFMLGNFYPILDMWDAKGWHNSYNSVFGDPFCFAAANYLISINIPQDYKLVSNGTVIKKVIQDDGREIHILQAEKVREVGMAIMPGYEQLSLKTNQAEVKVYYPGGSKSIAQNILDKSAKMLNYYACQFSSYPYSEFKVVFVPMQGFHGMEYSGMIFLRDDFLEKNYDNERCNFVLAHEIAHQWWYAMVGNDQLREPWLDEGLANWSAYKYLTDIEGISPPDTTSFKPDTNLARELQDIYSREEYYYMAYTGGEAFWFALEKELGTETVLKVLRRYAAEYRFRMATTDDLINIIKIEAHRDMQDYFNKWFNRQY